jgi:hypothetical protein
LKCDQIGRSEGVDACNGTMSSMDAGTITGIAVGTTLAVLACCGIVWLLLAKRRAVQAKNEPLFKSSTGELNHTDDLLTKSPGETSCSSGVDGVGDDYPEEAAMINKSASDDSEESQEVV